MSFNNHRPEEFDKLVIQIIEDNNINPFGNHGENGKRIRSQLVELMNTQNIDYKLPPNDQTLGSLLAVIAQDNKTNH